MLKHRSIKVRTFLTALSKLSFILWWGGFTFYAAFVIPAGQQVLGNHVLVGFITQRVSTALNISCATALLLTVLEGAWCWKKNSQNTQHIKHINLLVMAVLLAGLFYLHPVLGRFLDASSLQLRDEPVFYKLHRIYLLISSLLWLCGLVHLIRTLRQKI